MDNNFNEIAQIPIANVTNLTWIDETHLAYSISSELWESNTKSKISNKISNMPSSGALLGMSLSDQKDYLYLASEHGYSNPVIKRVSLKGRSFSEQINKLQVIMPIITNDYLMALVNFTRPTIFVQPTAYATDSYSQAAKSDLQSRGIDINGINLIFGQTN